MKISGSPALIAAQVYASATHGGGVREVAAAQRQAAKFEIKDEVSIRADRVEDRAPKSRDAAQAQTQDRAQTRDPAESGAGRREAPIEKPVLKRPGSLVNLTA